MHEAPGQNGIESSAGGLCKSWAPSGTGWPFAAAIALARRGLLLPIWPSFTTRHAATLKPERCSPVFLSDQESSPQGALAIDPVTLLELAD